MPQTEIAEILTDMLVQNKNNAENFEKVLTGINSKLDILSDENGASDVLRMYISELKNAMEDKHDNTISKLEEFDQNFNKIVTNEDFKNFRSDLADFVQKIIDNSSALNSSLSYNSEKVENVLAAIRSLDYKENFAILNETVLGVKEDFEKSAQNNLESLQSNIKNLSEKLDADFQAQKETILSGNNSEEQLESLKKISGDIKEIENVVQNGNIHFSQIIKENLSEIKGYIGEMTSSITLAKNESDEKLYTKLSHLDVLNAAFETSISSLQTNLKNVLDNILGISNSSAEVKNKVDGILESLNGVISTLDDISFKNEQLSSAISSLQEVVLKREDISEINSKISQFSQTAEINGEKLSNIAQKLSDIENIDYSYDIQQIISKIEDLSLQFENTSHNNYTSINENIAGSINDIRSSFENNSKMNYENIINEINNLKTEINSKVNNSEDFEKISTSLSDLTANLQYLNDISSQRYSQIIEEISKELHETLKNTGEMLNSNTELNFGDLKILTEKIASEIGLLRGDIAENNSSFVLSAGINSIQESINNLLSDLNGFKTLFEASSSDNAMNIMQKISDVSSQVDELKTVLSQQEYNNRIMEAVENLSLKFDNLGDNSDLSEKISSIKELVSAINAEFSLSRTEYQEYLSNINSVQTTQLQVISENVTGIETRIEETKESIARYINELRNISEYSGSQNFEQILQKLTDIEASYALSTQDREQKFSEIQNKLMEFAHIVEGSNSDTEGKISASLDEVRIIKDELSHVVEALNSSKNSSDEKFTELTSLLDSNVESIISDINSLNEKISDGLGNVVQEKLSLIDRKFYELSELLSNIRSAYSENELVKSIEDKIILLNEDLKHVNLGLEDAINQKNEEVMRVFESLKSMIDGFTGFDEERIISELKSQLELSFMNFSVDANSEFASNFETINRLEDAYKEAHSKISEIQEFIENKVQNDIELINTALTSGIKDIKYDFESRLDGQISELKSYLDVAYNDTRVQNAVEDFRQEMLQKIELMSGIQGHISEKQEEISNGISAISDNIKNFIVAVCQKVVERYNPDETKNLINSLSKETSELKGCFDAVNSKLDVLALNSTDEDLQERFDELSVSEKTISEMIEALHSKLDVVVSDNSSENLLDEIDEIKGIIFEQRKFFESAADERSAAIDKYLRDVLVKLDNVDIEKNAEDIKESIMNALVSLIDQISFVEETEEIKDFVEEKTSEINQNLQEVQNQLKQILTSDDDSFDYTYTLQDVESDIAKLRLAINNISENDYDKVFDEVNRLSVSLENIENSLTQDEIKEVKNDIEKLQDDIISISSRTNKLLLNSDESCKSLNDGLENFSNVVSRLEEKINYLDNTKVGRIEDKINHIQSLAQSSSNADKVFHQTMMYLGEWIDSATEQISNIQNGINNVCLNLPTQDALIEEIKKVLPNNTELVRDIERRFILQQERIDKLENKLDRILSTLEEKDDNVLNRKLDKIETVLSQFGTNIEKLTSYVDEE